MPDDKGSVSLWIIVSNQARTTPSRRCGSATSPAWSGWLTSNWPAFLIDPTWPRTWPSVSFTVSVSVPARAVFSAWTTAATCGSLLAVLTTRKAVSTRRREGAAKRGGGQVVAVRTWPPGRMTPVRDLFGNLSAAEPTPEAAAAAEEIHRLLELLGDEQLRQVVRARLEGYANEEIADRLGIALATVERNESACGCARRKSMAEGQRPGLRDRMEGESEHLQAHGRLEERRWQRTEMQGPSRLLCWWTPSAIVSRRRGVPAIAGRWRTGCPPTPWCGPNPGRVGPGRIAVALAIRSGGASRGIPGPLSRAGRQTPPGPCVCWRPSTSSGAAASQVLARTSTAADSRGWPLTPVGGASSARRPSPRPPPNKPWRGGHCHLAGRPGTRAPGRLRDPGRAGPGRHGHRLQGLAGRHQTAGGLEDDPLRRRTSAEESELFRAEAEAVARLPAPQHRAGVRGRRVARPDVPAAGVRRRRHPGAAPGRPAPAGTRGGNPGGDAGPGHALRPLPGRRPP